MKHDDQGNSMESQPQRTKVFTDFHEIFSVCRALNYEYFDQKSVQKASISVNRHSRYFYH